MEADTNNYDIIIIGAGFAGLTAGSILASKGYNTIVLEKNPYPGGCVSSFKRKGHTFENTIHFINGCDKGGIIYKILEKFGTEKSIKFIRLKNLYRYIDETTGLDINPPLEFESYIKYIETLFPREIKNLKRFYKDFSELIEFVFGLSEMSPAGAALTALLNMRLMLRFLLNIPKPASKIIGRYINDPALRNYLTSICAAFGYPTNKMSGMTLSFCEVSYRTEGAFFPEGSSSAFAGAMAGACVSNGGKILYNSEVEEILFNGKECSGVKAVKDNGEFVIKGRAVISAIDLTRLVTDIVPAGRLPLRYVNKIKKREPTYACVNVFIGLDIDITERGITDGKIWLQRRGGFDSEDEAVLDTFDLSGITMEMISVFNNIDPSLVPDGKSTISLQYITRYALFNDLLDEKGRRGEKYNKTKEKIAGQAVEILSKRLGVPDMEEHIEVINVATPITLERYTGNRRGSHLGWHLTPKYNWLDMISNKTPVKNLFIAGHWTMPGGGVSTVMKSGEITANFAEKYIADSSKKQGL